MFSVTNQQIEATYLTVLSKLSVLSKGRKSFREKQQNLFLLQKYLMQHSQEHLVLSERCEHSEEVPFRKLQQLHCNHCRISPDMLRRQVKGILGHVGHSIREV